MREFRIFRGWFGARRVSVQHILNELDEPTRPEGISNRHWNMLPQDLRDATEQEMLCYIQGWEDSRSNVETNPYHDRTRRNLWNRGFLRRRGRTGMNYGNVNPNPPIDETYPEYYNTDDFVFCDVTEIRYDRIDGRPFKLMLYRSIEGGDTVQGQRINPDHPMWNFPDVI